MAENKRYGFFVDGDYMFLWRRCIVPECKYFVCIGASEEFCFFHAMKELLHEQIEAINRAGYRATPIADGWVPRDLFWADDRKRMEQLISDAVSLGINYVDNKWQKSAEEIVRIINIPE